jgi:ketosteroid isomerase-like protein
VKRAYGLGVTILLLVASGAVALGQAPRKPAAAGEDVAGTAAILDHVWLDAAHNHDGDTAAWLFADDFVEIHPGGFLVNKQQQVNMIANTQLGDLAIQSSDIQVRYASPDVAVLTDTTTIRGKQGETSYDGQYRVIRVFAKLNGRWRAAGAGIARITAAQ